MLRGRRLPTLAAGILLLVLMAQAPIASAHGLDPALRGVASRSPGRQVVAIVQFAPSRTVGRARAIVRAHGGRDESVLPLIHGVAARLTARAAVGLARLASVRAVSLNARVHVTAVAGMNPTSLATKFNLSAMTQNLWGRSTGAGIGVAVIDTGVAGNLPDFRASPSDASSRVIGSAVVNPNATTASDAYGHGTMVAGLIAGNGFNRSTTDPLFGQYAGAAPGANIVSIKVSSDQGQATVLDLLYGLQFAIDHKSDYNIQVINLSVVSDSAQSYTTDPLDAAVEAAWFDGITVVAAAGNHGLGAGVDYAPGNDPYVITVGALGDTQTILEATSNARTYDQAQIQALRQQGASAQQIQTVSEQFQQNVLAIGQSAGLPAPWSSSGATQDGVTKPDVYGPGRFIVAPLAPGSVFATKCPVCVVGGQYIMASGTSLATPIVAGAVADLLQANPGWTPDMVKGALMDTATAPPGYPAGSAGLLNASVALTAPATALASNQGLTPSSLLVLGGGSPTWSQWTRSSWSAAGSSLSAPWARSSWSCTCSSTGQGGVTTTRSSWSTAGWTIDFSDVTSLF